MVLSEEELEARITSPMNLLNRLKTVTNPHHRPGGAPIPAQIPALPPTASELIPDLDSKITNGAIKGKALNIINEAMNELRGRIPEMHKPRDIAAVAAEMTRVINAVEPREQVNPDNAPKIIIYAPQIMSEDTFNVVELKE